MKLRLQDAAEKCAAQATLRAVRILSRALASQLKRLRGKDDALTQALGRIKELEARNGILTEMIQPLQTRLQKIAPKKRPHYSGPARFKALQVRQAMGWSIEEAAAQFVVTLNTFTRWEQAADPVRKTVGPDITPCPPLQRYPDVVRETVRVAERLGMGRAHLIAAHAARAGWKISKTYVESVLTSPTSDPPPDLPDSSPRMPLKGEFVGHVYILDSHEIKNFLGVTKSYLTGVMDAYSHAPLGMFSSETAPTAKASAALLKRVMNMWGRPKYVAIDGGPEFKGVLREAAKTAKVKVRLGSPGKTTITGLIERFWRTLDQMIGLPLDPPSDLAELERRLSFALSYYVAFRPIYALAATTPAERLAGITPLAHAAVQPPRERDLRAPPPIVVGWLDPIGLDSLTFRPRNRHPRGSRNAPAVLRTAPP
jgi:hypothetical protein